MAKHKRSYRLPYDQDALFSGSEINRGRPIKFKLENRIIHGYVGDTILSALLASGIDSVGLHDGQPVALSENFCPPVLIQPRKGQEQCVLPMDRTPALDGLEMTLYGLSKNTPKPVRPKIYNTFSGLWKKTNPSLDFEIEEQSLPYGPWLDMAEQESFDFDLVVVGGGIAGMSAALTGAKNGIKVALVEKQSVLGGDAMFFGAIEGEKRPEDFVRELVAELKNSPLVETFMLSEALSADQDGVRVHKISVAQGAISSKIIKLVAAHTVLATGVIEKLPLFCGNRLPGVIGAKSAFHMAAKFGIWRGETVALNTVSSAASQTLLLAADMGVKVINLTDARPNPKSRFIEFAKAYGISLATGTLIMSAVQENDQSLTVQLGLSSDNSKPTGEKIILDQLVVNGGWHPNLQLWHGAGGKLMWSGNTQQLCAEGEVFGLILAGSCNGERHMSECKLSGEQVVLSMLGSQDNKGKIALNIANYESEDGTLPVSNLNLEHSNCYLDMNTSLMRPLPKLQTNFWKQLLVLQKKDPEILQGGNHGTCLGDVVAKVILGEISPKIAGVFAAERCGYLGALTLQDKDVQPQSPSSLTPQLPPPFLMGRFGSLAQVIKISLQGMQHVEVGCLIYADHENFLPDAAIGVVVGANSSEKQIVFAYLDKNYCAKNSHFVLKNGTQSVPATPDF